MKDVFWSSGGEGYKFRQWALLFFLRYVLFGGFLINNSKRTIVNVMADFRLPQSLPSPLF